MSESKAMIVGLEGPVLTASEKAFFAAEKPWGYILFARNIIDDAQLRSLTASLRGIDPSRAVAILIDQEGGRVQRLRPPLAPDYPSAAALGALFARNREAGLRAAWLLSRLHAFDLGRFGIDVDCLPVLDIPVPGSHGVIGDRAYGDDAATVTDMGRAAIDGLIAGGVAPVIKHIPGHGRSRADTHLELPVVDTPHAELAVSDFRPFMELADAPMAMSAHVIYSAIDPEHPATTSKAVISDIIRGELAYDGLLMSDDVSMKALSGSFEARTSAIFGAGCDMVLHCNGDMAEMRAVASQTPPLKGEAARRADAALGTIGRPDATDEAAARSEFAALTASGAA